MYKIRLVGRHGRVEGKKYRTPPLFHSGDGEGARLCVRSPFLSLNIFRLVWSAESVKNNHLSHSKQKLRRSPLCHQNPIKANCFYFGSVSALRFDLFAQNITSLNICSNLSGVTKVYSVHHFENANVLTCDMSAEKKRWDVSQDSTHALYSTFSGKCLCCNLVQAFHSRLSKLELLFAN